MMARLNLDIDRKYEQTDEALHGLPVTGPEHELAETCWCGPLFVELDDMAEPVDEAGAFQTLVPYYEHKVPS